MGRVATLKTEIKTVVRGGAVKIPDIQPEAIGIEPRNQQTRSRSPLLPGNKSVQPKGRP
jgi:hypothetical protein